MMTPKIQLVQKVKDVIKKVCFKNSLTFFLLIPLIFFSCKTMEVQEDMMGSYEIEKLRTESGSGMKIHLKYYELEKPQRTIPFSFAVVNNLFVYDSIFPIYKETNTLNIETSVLERHNMSLKDIKIKSGDSLIIKIYMKERNTVYN